MWVYVSLGLIVGLVLLVGMLFWLMFRRGDRQMEQQLTVWNQAFDVQAQVIDALVQERQVQAAERQHMSTIMQHLEEWLVYVVGMSIGQKPSQPQLQSGKKDEPQQGGPTALGNVLTGDDG